MNDTPTSRPVPPRSRHRWPIVAGVLAVLVIASIVATALVAGIRPGRGAGEGQATAAGEVALQMAVADAGGTDVLADGPGQPGTPTQSEAPAPGPGPRGGPGHRGGLFGRLGDDTLLVGTVSSAGNGTLTVARDSGGDKSVTTTESTRIRGAGKQALGDLKAGDRVVVRVGASSTATGVLALRPHVAGTVTALDGDRATVVRASGLVQVVDMSAISQKPQVGDLIAAVGTLADNGTTLKADQLRVLPTTPR